MKTVLQTVLMHAKNCKMPAMAVAIIALFLVAPLGGPMMAGHAQMQLPPDSEELLDDAEQLQQELDTTLQGLDPTDQLPTTTMLEMRSVIDATDQKLSAYKAQLASGLLPTVPMDDVDIDDIVIQEGTLPPRTLTRGSDLLDQLGISELIEAPTACAVVDPSGGTTTTTFTFDASCSTDIQSSTRDLEARWDWTGDGIWDTPWGGLTSSHQYPGSGNHQPVAQVRDADGNTETTTMAVQVSGPPSACFSVTPTSGTTSTTFNVDASCSTDDMTSSSQLKVRWDWTNDGAWDTSWSTDKTTGVSYGATGTKTIAVEVKDAAELVSKTTRSVSVSSSSGDSGGGGGGTGTTCRPGMCHTSSSSTTTPIEPVLQYLAEQVEGVEPVTDPVRYQRYPGGPFEAAHTGEAWHVEGIELRLQPIHAVAAQVDTQWLASAFGTYGSPAQFTIRNQDGGTYASVTDPMLLQGTVAAFEPITIGASDHYTMGHADMVELVNQSARIFFTEWPGEITTLHESGGNSTTQQTTTSTIHRLGIQITGTPSPAILDGRWLSELGMNDPLFFTEAGATITSIAEGTQFLLPEPPENIYIEDASLQPPGPTTMSMSTSSSTNTYRDDDGSMNTWYDFDYSDDVARKRLVLPTNALTGATSAELHVFARAAYCGGIGSPHTLYVNGVSAHSYNSCNKWGTSSFSWSTFNIGLASLSAGTTNTFQITDSNSWNDLDHHFALDTDNDFGRTDASANGKDKPGELMWYLTITTSSSTNSEPTACFDVTPSTGTTSTTFEVDAGCSSDAETSTANLQARWDWEDDGVYDTAYSTDKTKSHSYSTTGFKTIRVEVRDSDGDTNTDTAVVGVSSSNSPPEACFQVSPSSGTTDTEFKVNAECSWDSETSDSQLEARWDWDNNGVYDTAYSIDKTQSHWYSSTGSKTIKVQVRDGDGATDTATQTVSVMAPATGIDLDEDFEGSINAWSLTGLWSKRNCRAYTGDYALAYNQGTCSKADYDVGATTGSAISPWTKVPTNDPVLSFASWYQTEGGTAWDRKYVEVSRDGSNWDLVTQIVGTMKVWRTQSYSLDDYAGEDILVRFRFDSGDHLYNRYEGWLVDDVRVQTNVGNRVYSSEWTHDQMKTSRYEKYFRHDESAEVGWPLNDPSDSIAQTFDVNRGADDPGSSSSLLYIWGRSGSSQCNSNSHDMTLNGKLLFRFSPCLWTTSYGWKGFSIPTYMLDDGENVLSIVPNCSCGQSLYVAVDSSGPGSYTDLEINGAAEPGVEAYWYLFVRQTTVIEMLGRMRTIEYNDDGQIKQQHQQESHAFTSREEGTMVSLIRRELEDGSRTYQSNSMDFLKREEYNSNTKVQGEKHYVLEMSEAGNHVFLNSPTVGDRFSWHLTEFETLAPDSSGNGWARNQGRYVQLVPAQPGSWSDWDPPYMNPRFGASSHDADSPWNTYENYFNAEFFMKTCETANRRHGFMHSNPHPHDCMGLRVHLWDMDNRPDRLHDARDATVGIVTEAVNAMDNGVEDWQKKTNKMSLQGFLTSWFYGIAQTGDFVSLQERETDRTAPNGLIYPATWIASVPSLPFLDMMPGDPHVPLHLLSWDGTLDIYWTGDL